MRRLPLIMVATLSMPAMCFAQGFTGFDTRKKPKPPPPVVVPASPDYAIGEPIIAVPPRAATGKLDLDAYKVLHAALKERLGQRLLGETETLKVIEADDPATLDTAETQVQFADALKAKILVVFSRAAHGVSVTLVLKPGGKATADATVDVAGGKLTQGLARRLVADLLKRADTDLKPGLDLSEPVVEAQPPAAPPSEESYEDDATVAQNRRPDREARPFQPSALQVFAGGGASFRSLSAASTVPVVPHAPAAIAAMGFDLTVYPLRFLPSLADSKLAELGIEGFYRYDIVRGQSDVAGVTSQCSALDDDMRGQLFYRYPLGGRLPKVGLGVGLAQERTRFASACTAPALNTTFGSTEVQLKVQENIIGENLGIELAGGPRILFTTRAAGRTSQAWSAEGWVTARPLRYIAVRLGGRFTWTRETTWPEGVGLIDRRTFVGLEVGASLW